MLKAPRWISNSASNIGMSNACFSEYYCRFDFNFRVLVMDCRSGCGACCIAPSISSAIPGMPAGKAAGERCLHLSVDMLCAIFGLPERPAVCSQFKAAVDVCGDSQGDAIRLITWWEEATAVA